MPDDHRGAIEDLMSIVNETKDEVGSFETEEQGLPVAPDPLKHVAAERAGALEDRIGEELLIGISSVVTRMTPVPPGHLAMSADDFEIDARDRGAAIESLHDRRDRVWTDEQDVVVESDDERSLGLSHSGVPRSATDVPGKRDYSDSWEFFGDHAHTAVR
jgi:hypothetical protein